MLHETNTLLINKLPVAPGAPYEIAAQLTIGPVAKGQIITVFGESHGNPQQANQTECAWATGISIYDNGTAVAHPCPYRGRDLEKNRKHDDCRAGAFQAQSDYGELVIQYRMRAVNLSSGGNLELSWVKLQAIVSGEAGEPLPPPVPGEPITDLTYLGTAQSAVDSNSYTFNGTPFGTGDIVVTFSGVVYRCAISVYRVDNKILVCTGGRTNNSGRTVTGISVGGVPLTELKSVYNPNGGTDYASIWGDHTLIDNAASISPSGLTMSGSLDVIDGGAVIACMGGGQFNYSWSGIAKDMQTDNVEGGYYYTSGSALFPTGQTVNISCTSDSSISNPAFVAVSLGNIFSS